MHYVSMWSWAEGKSKNKLFPEARLMNGLWLRILFLLLNQCSFLSQNICTLGRRWPLGHLLPRVEYCWWLAWLQAHYLCLCVVLISVLCFNFSDD